MRVPGLLLALLLRAGAALAQCQSCSCDGCLATLDPSAHYAISSTADASASSACLAWPGMSTTTTLAPTTTTITVTEQATVDTTVSEAITLNSTATVFGTVTSTYTSVNQVNAIVTSTVYSSTDVSTTTYYTTIGTKTFWRRQAAATPAAPVPSQYSPYCSGGAAFLSACQCIGVSPTTFTTRGATATSTVTVSQTVIGSTSTDYATSYNPVIVSDTTTVGATALVDSTMTSVQVMTATTSVGTSVLATSYLTQQTDAPAPTGYVRAYARDGSTDVVNGQYLSHDDGNMVLTSNPEEFMQWYIGGQNSGWFGDYFYGGNQLVVSTDINQPYAQYHDSNSTGELVKMTNFVIMGTPSDGNPPNIFNNYKQLFAWDGTNGEFSNCFLDWNDASPDGPLTAVNYNDQNPEFDGTRTVFQICPNLPYRQGVVFDLMLNEGCTEIELRFSQDYDTNTPPLGFSTDYPEPVRAPVAEGAYQLDTDPVNYDYPRAYIYVLPTGDGVIDVPSFLSWDEGPGGHMVFRNNTQDTQDWQFQYYGYQNLDPRYNMAYNGTSFAMARYNKTDAATRSANYIGFPPFVDATTYLGGAEDNTVPALALTSGGLLDDSELQSLWYWSRPNPTDTGSHESGGGFVIPRVALYSDGTMTMTGSGMTGTWVIRDQPLFCGPLWNQFPTWTNQPLARPETVSGVFVLNIRGVVPPLGCQNVVLRWAEDPRTIPGAVIGPAFDYSSYIGHNIYASSETLVVEQPTWGPQTTEPTNLPIPTS